MWFKAGGENTTLNQANFWLFKLIGMDYLTRIEGKIKSNNTLGHNLDQTEAFIRDTYPMCRMRQEV